jgi:hypothetical protein
LNNSARAGNIMAAAATMPSCGTLGTATIGPDHAHISRRVPSARRDMRANGRTSRAGQLRLLFATVGDEIDGIPISVVSVLARLGLDPREEAGRLSSLGNREAVEQLARLIAEVPGGFRPLGEARLLADDLVGLLPKHRPSRTSALQGQIRPPYRAPPLPKPSQFLDCLPCPHGSGAGQRCGSRRVSVRYREPVSGKRESRHLSAKHRFIGGRSVSAVEDRRWPRRFRGDHPQRDDMGKVVGRPSVVPVRSKEEAKQQAKTLARSLGLKVYGIIDKTDAGGSLSSPQVDPAEIVGPDIDYTKTNEVQPPWSVPGAEKSL